MSSGSTKNGLLVSLVEPWDKYLVVVTNNPSIAKAEHGADAFWKSISGVNDLND